MLKCVWKVHHKYWTFSWQKVYKNVTHWIVATNALARSRIVTHCYATSFSRKIILCETNNIFYSRGNKKWDKTKLILKVHWKQRWGPLGQFCKFCLCQQLFKWFSIETRLSNILKTTNATKFIKTILESTYKVVVGTDKLADPTRLVILLRVV